MTLQFRRGSEAIAKANEAAKSGGNTDFRPFLTNFYWKDDQEVKYLWILNPLEDIPLVQMQKVWTKDSRSEYVIARTADVLGESSDPIEDKWGYGPQDLNICVACEVKPVMEVVRGRERPVEFEVAYRTFERKVRDDKGQPTGEVEEVTAPIVGMIAQSPNNFFNHVASKDANVAPIHEFAMAVRRIGVDKNTDYEIDLFDDKPLNPDNLLEYFDSISYLSDEDKDALAVLIDGDPENGVEALSDEDAAVAIGEALLNKRLNEMADLDYYNRIFAAIDSPARYPSKKYREANGGAKDEEPKTERKARPSQRRGRRAEAQVEPEAEVKDEPREEAKSARPRTSRRSVDKSSPVRERLEELKRKTEAKNKS